MSRLPSGPGPVRAVLAAALLLLTTAVHAHPLGQNAYNREAAILVEPDKVQLNYLIDLAEVPTLSAGEQADTNRDGTVSDQEWSDYATRWATSLPASLAVSVGGKPLALALTNQTWRISPGQSGLSILRMIATLSAPIMLDAQATTLEYHDQTQANRLGWKEVWIGAANGASILQADVPQTDRSKALTDFTPRAEGPPALTAARADIALAAPGTAVDATANAATLAAFDLAIGAKYGAEKPASTDESNPIWSFFKLGIRHIAGGWDHLMFLLGLVLLSGNLRKLTITVTAFTVAHSVTLALAAYGLVHPPASWVEILVAATIAYVGAVALTGWKTNHGPWLAFGFGLIHGLGFAGALAESLGAGNRLRLTGLLSFNLGIEAFQLSLVCVVVPVLRALARRPNYDLVYKLLASFVFIAGMQWFLVRTLGDGTVELAVIAILIAGILAFVVRSRRRGEMPVMG